MNYVNIKFMLFLCVGIQNFFGSDQVASLGDRRGIRPLVIKGVRKKENCLGGGLSAEKYKLFKRQIERYHHNFLRMMKLTQEGTQRHKEAESDYKKAKEQITETLKKYIKIDFKAFFSNLAQTDMREYKEESGDSSYFLETLQIADSALPTSYQSEKMNFTMFMKGLIEKHEIMGRVEDPALSVRFGARISSLTPENIVLFCKGTEADLQKKLPKQDTSNIHIIDYDYDNERDKSTSQLSQYESVSNHLWQLPLKYRFQKIGLIPRNEKNFAAQHFMTLQNSNFFSDFANRYEICMMPIICSVHDIALAVAKKPELSIKPYIPSILGLCTLGVVSKNTSWIWPLLSIIGSCGLVVHPVRIDLKRRDLYKRNCKAFQEIRSLMENVIKGPEEMLYLTNLDKISLEIARILQRNQLTIQPKQEE